MRIIPKSITMREGCWTRPVNAVLNYSCTERDYSYLAQKCGMTAHKEEGNFFCAWVGSRKTDIKPVYTSEEAYAMDVSPDGVNITANTAAGLSMGVKALWRMLSENTTLNCCRIDDEPALKFRAVHLCIFPKDDGTQKEDTSPAAIRKMINEAAYWGYNRVFLEFWGCFPYQKRPYACWPDTEYTPALVAEIISECMDGLHMQAMPVQNLTSHAGWSRIGSRKHVVLDQRPDLAPMWIPGGWCFATENPDTRAYLNDIMDELIAAYRQPPILHVSTDKCFGFGSSEADRVYDADGLFVRHLNFLHDSLAEKGVRMMMWTDMLYGALDSKFWKASPAVVDQLPRDILMNVWTHNDVGICWPDVDFFQGKGYETVYSPFKDENSIRNMISMCQRKHSLGIVQTTWYCPQTALPYVQLSGKLQWEGKER